LLQITDLLAKLPQEYVGKSLWQGNLKAQQIVCHFVTLFSKSVNHRVCVCVCVCVCNEREDSYHFLITIDT
jgi:hypothetical protein